MSFESQSFVAWEYGDSLTLVNSAGTQTFLDERLIIGVNLGSAHQFSYNDGSMETRYKGMLTHGDVQITPANIRHNVSWSEATFNINFLDIKKISALFEDTELDITAIQQPDICLQNPYLKAVTLELVDAVQAQSMGVYIESLLFSLFAKYGLQKKQLSMRKIPKGLSRLDPRWTRLHDYIANNIHTRISLEALAAEANLSKFHLSREYTRLFGESLAQAIRRKRLALACQMLKTTQLSMKQIAANTGYLSSAHFSRSFKAMFGVTPSGFRNSS